MSIYIYFICFHEKIHREVIMTNEINAIILAAGKGTRMKSHLPKVLHEIFNKPLLGWVIESIESLNHKTNCYCVLGHGIDKIEDYLKKNYPNAKTVVQKEQLGTGHAVTCAIPYMENFKGTVLITCGDTPLIKSETLEKFINYHTENNCDLTVMSAVYDNPFGYGRIVRNEKGNVARIVEQKDADINEKSINEVNAGVYCLNWEKIKPIFKKLNNNNSQGEYYLTDIVKIANEDNLKVLSYKIEDNSEIFGINSRKNLAEAFDMMNKRHLEKLMENGVTIVDTNSTFISPETTIENDTIVYPNTYIEGKNEIASFCKIGPMARLRGNCTVGENVKIGNFVELKNARIAKNSHVCHLTYMGDAIVGEDVNIGAGTIFANYNSITKEKKVSTLEDGVSIGSNSVLVAPVHLGKNAFTAALSCITKDVEENSLAMTRTPQKEYKNWVINKEKENES